MSNFLPFIPLGVVLSKRVEVSLRERKQVKKEVTSLVQVKCILCLSISSSENAQGGTDDG